jgi:hypothetical protein
VASTVNLEPVDVMKLEYIPLLQIQRDIYRTPRGMKRFEEYLEVLRSGLRDRLLPVPLIGINPMAREHVDALLDRLLELDADGIGARAAAEVAAQLPEVPAEFKLSVVVGDDAKGGGTNRYAYEMDLRFGPPSFRGRTGPRKWPEWHSAFLWSSEAPSERAVREAVRAIAFRLAYGAANPPPVTIRDMLAQEGWVMARAGCEGPTLDTEDLAYTREALAPHLEASDLRTAIECLFGDAAARSLGFTPRGLSPWAGLALALHDARGGDP